MKSFYTLLTAAAVALTASAAHVNINVDSSKQLRGSDVLAKKEVRVGKAADLNQVSGKSLKADNVSRKYVSGMRKVDSNSSIEGTWVFSLGDYYFQTSVGSFTCEFEATLDGNSVWFEDPTNNELPFVAEYEEATGTLTFTRYYLGSTGTYYIYQEPFVYNWDTDDLDVQDVVGEYNGIDEITFAADNGISWAACTNQAGTNRAGYFGIYDLEGAIKEVSWKLVGEASFLENIIYGTFTGEENTTVSKHELYESPYTPGIYKLINPFSTLYSELNFSGTSPQMLIDATNPDNVLVEMQATGISGGATVGAYYYFNEGWYCEEFGEDLDPSLVCTLTKTDAGEVTITFPYHSCTVYASTAGSFYYGSAYASTLTFTVPVEEEPEQPGDELSGTANMTYQVDMNMGWYDEPDLTEPVTDEVEVAYVDGKLRFDTFGGCDLPITFEVNVEEGTATATDQVAYIDDWYESEEDYMYYYYGSVANKTAEVTAELFNVEGEEFTTMIVETWGEYLVEYSFFNSAFYNTVIELPFKIEGLPEKTAEVVPSLEGEWSITLNGHYLGAYSLGVFTEKFIATQEGDVVTFESTGSQYDMKANLMGNTLYFKSVLVGSAEATYGLYQVPYVNNTGITEIDDLEAARVDAVTAIVDVEAGTITFEENAGLLYGYFETENGGFSYWDDAFDFVSAVKGEAQVGETTITIENVVSEIAENKLLVNIEYTTENVPAGATIYATFTHLNEADLNEKVLAENGEAYFEFEEYYKGNYYVTLTVEDAQGIVIATSNTEEFYCGSSAINSIETEGAAVRYFNLQGVELAAPAAGTTVIKVEGNKATKVLVK